MSDANGCGGIDMKQIEVVAAVIRKDDKIFAKKDELDSVKWLPADKEVVEEVKKHI